LLYWSVPINRMLSSVSPNWFFLLGFSFFLLGPSLYWYTKSLIYHDYSLKRRDIPHLLPALLYPLYMFMIYYRHNDDYKLQLLRDYEIVTANPWFEGLIWSQRLIIVVYGFLSLRQLIRYKQYLKQNYS